MKVYISFWPQAKRYKNNFIEEDLFTRSLDLCFNLAQKHYKQINLITDALGEEKLRDKYKWDSIDLSLEDLDKNFQNVWNLGKIKAYNIISQKGDPFLHLDYDVFLFNPLPENILKENIFCQSIEMNTHKKYQVNNFLKLCKNKYYAKNISTNKSPNCGIIGGKDLDFFYQYSKSALQMVFDKDNLEFWNSEKVPSWQKACILEQYYMQTCLYFFKKETVSLYKDYLQYKKEFFLKNDGYLHAFGEEKEKDIKMGEAFYLKNV